MRSIISIYFVGLILLSLLWSGCEEPEGKNPVDSLQLVTIEMGPEYSTQHYFDLGTESVVHSHDREIWDFAMDASSSGNTILMNTSKVMQVWRTGKSNLAEVSTNISIAAWEHDASTGEADKIVLNNWIENEVYVVDRGVKYKPKGAHIGYVKMKMQKLGLDSLKIVFSDLDNNNASELRVATRSLTHSYLYFSFDEGGKTVEAAPAKDTWDLLFTQYATDATIPEYPNDTLYYSLNGVLLNPYQVKCAEDSTPSFEEVTIQDIEGFAFSSFLDVIGYDWKEFTISANLYNIVPGKYYVVKDVEGNYYKMRFIDFVNSLGENGYPKFELQKL